MKRRICFFTLLLCLTISGICYGGWNQTQSATINATTGSMDFFVEERDNFQVSFLLANGSKVPYDTVKVIDKVDLASLVIGEEEEQIEIEEMMEQYAGISITYLIIPKDGTSVDELLVGEQEEEVCLHGKLSGIELPDTLLSESDLFPTIELKGSKLTEKEEEGYRITHNLYFTEASIKRVLDRKPTVIMTREVEKMQWVGLDGTVIDIKNEQEKYVEEEIADEAFATGYYEFEIPVVEQQAYESVPWMETCYCYWTQSMPIGGKLYGKRAIDIEVEKKEKIQYIYEEVSQQVTTGIPVETEGNVSDNSIPMPSPEPTNEIPPQPTDLLPSTGDEKGELGDGNTLPDTVADEPSGENPVD